MKAATLFSGIGAPEMAMPHWTWIWHAEIEKFPAAVMAERFPESVNLGDVTAHDFVDRALAIGRPDILVFGSPCQSFSVAGKRLGLDDARGNLALVALGIVARLRPDWFVFENVPGLLSSANGSDFGLFLRAVEECGYLGVWRGLDAQYFGLAQRRKRVFFVGRAGDWRGPAAVLLEPESLCGDSPSREQARQEIAVPIGAGSTRSGGRVGYREAAAGQVIPQAFGGGNQSGSIEVATTTTKGGQRQDFETDTFAIQAGALRENPNSGPDGVGAQAGIAYTLEARSEVQAVAHCAPVHPTLNAGGNATGGPRQPGMSADTADGLIVTHALRSEGFDATEDGIGRGTPLVCAEVAQTLTSGGNGERGRQDPTNCDLIVAVFDPNQVTSPDNRSQPTEGLSHTLPVKANAPIAFSMKDHGADAGELAPTLRAGNHSDSHANGGSPPAVAGIGVRRLMPVECERLQGFPDHHTAILYRGKPAADGPRYKAIGNSMAVPVVRWILTRIEFVDRLLKERVA